MSRSKRKSTVRRERNRKRQEAMFESMRRSAEERDKRAPFTRFKNPGKVSYLFNRGTGRLSFDFSGCPEVRPSTKNPVKEAEEIAVRYRDDWEKEPTSSIH